MENNNYNSIKKILTKDFGMRILETEDGTTDSSEEYQMLLVGIRFSVTNLTMVLTVNVNHEGIIFNFSNLVNEINPTEISEIDPLKILYTNSHLRYGNFIIQEGQEPVLEYRYSLMTEGSLSEDFLKKILVTCFQTISENAPLLLEG